MRALLPWATSAGTLLGMWLVGQKRSVGWVVGLCNQVFWVATSIAYGTWGFLPLTCALIVIYTRALVAWRRDEREARDPMLAEALRYAAEPIDPEPA